MMMVRTLKGLKHIFHHLVRGITLSININLSYPLIGKFRLFLYSDKNGARSFFEINRMNCADQTRIKRSDDVI